MIVGAVTTILLIIAWASAAGGADDDLSSASTITTAESIMADELRLSIVGPSSPVSPNSTVRVAAKTEPGADCRIEVSGGSESSRIEGLEAMRADENGVVSWTWWVGPNTSPGSRPIVVTASLGERSARAEITLVIQP